MLILDEPTSGVDPLARDALLGAADRSFAQSGRDDLRLHAFHERSGALRPHCAHGFRPRAGDRHAGRPRQGARRRHPRRRLHQLSGGGDRAAPAGSRRERIAVRCGWTPVGRTPPRAARVQPAARCSPMRSARRWSCGAIRSASASRCFGTAFLMLVFGFGISTDVDNLSFAVLDRDQTPREPRLSRGAARLELFRREARRSPTTPISSSRLRSGDIKPRSRSRQASAAISNADVRPEVGAWVDGAMPFRAETIRGYLQACTSSI